MQAVLAHHEEIPVETLILCTSRRTIETKALDCLELVHRELQEQKIAFAAYMIILRSFSRRTLKMLCDSEYLPICQAQRTKRVPGIGLGNLPNGRFLGSSKQCSATVWSKDRFLCHEGDRIIVEVSSNRIDDYFHLQTAFQLQSALGADLRQDTSYVDVILSNIMSQRYFTML